MKFLPSSVFTVAAWCALLGSARGADGTSVKLSDPAKPARLEVRVGRANLQLQGTDTTEVAVQSETKPAAKNEPRADGLRVISSSAGYTLTEKDNVVTLDAMTDDWKKGGGDFKLTVPRGIAVVLQSMGGGDIRCAGVAGNIEINSMNGVIRLDDITGGVVASTMNGKIHANVRELRDGNALSFTSMNGEVVVRVPAAAKANVRLRTQNGSVLTDFDEAALVTRTETAPGGRTRRVVTVRSGQGGVSDEVHEAIREAAEVSATAVREAMTAVKEGLAVAREEMSRARARKAAEAGDPAAPAAPLPPIPPLPPKVPTITGGKLVTGALNGGGPEISVSTMNGDVTLRRLEAAK